MAPYPTTRIARPCRELMTGLPLLLYLSYLLSPALAAWAREGTLRMEKEKPEETGQGGAGVHRLKFAGFAPTLIFALPGSWRNYAGHQNESIWRQDAMLRFDEIEGT